MFKAKRLIAGMAIAAMCVTSFVSGSEAEAAKKPSLSKKKVTIKVKKSTKIKIKNVKAKKIKKLTVKTSKKKIATVKTNGKAAFTITGKKAGKAVITAKVKVGKKTTTLKVNVTVKNASPATDAEVSAAPSATPSATPAPTATPAIATATPVPTVDPNATFAPVVYKTATFEEGTDGFTGRVGNEQISVVEDGYEGKGLFVSGRSMVWHGAKIDVANTIVPGATYKVTAYMKHTADSAVEIKCTGQTGNSFPGIASAADVEPNVWTRLEGTIEIPAIISDYIIYFEIPGSETADFYLDNIEIVQITEAKEPEVLTSMLETYQHIFPYIGTCLTYSGWGGPGQLQSAPTMEYVKHHYNSFTLENEMKPQSILGNTATKITVAEAEAKGYVIPENYTEEYVPQLNFDALDHVMEIAHDNGMKMRAHTLLWHQQTAVWFFAENYSGSTVTTPEIMDARLEFYVRTVMKHIMDKEREVTGANGTIVYAWDIVNEYLHRTNDPQSMSWVDVYGNLGLRPTYVKKAYQFAYDMLKQYGVEDEVVLFYNDYNTYYEVDNLVKLMAYINEGEEANICGGIGMQSHVDVKRPSVEKFSEALDAFMATGLEVQITELDVTINYDNLSTDKTDEDQAEYVKEFMEMLVLRQRDRDTSVSPKGITGVTLWGLYDGMSWRSSYSPLLFGSSIVDPKPSFYSFIEAAQIWNS